MWGEKCMMEIIGTPIDWNLELERSLQELTLGYKMVLMFAFQIFYMFFVMCFKQDSND